MAENLEEKPGALDARPKSGRSRSADRKDGYLWSGKKLSRLNKNASEGDGEAEKAESRERKHSCSSLELDLDRSCGRKLLGRSLKQKLQDAVGQCFPIKACGGGASSAALSSKRKIHISELMLDKCPFPPKSDLAYRWHFIKRHTAPVDKQRVVRDAPKVETLDVGEQSCDGGEDLLSSVAAAREDSDADADSDDEIVTFRKKRSKAKWEAEDEIFRPATPPKYHTQIDYVHCLVPDLFQINNNPCYWGVMDRYAAEALLDGKPEGTFLLRDSAQEDYLFSVSFRRYSRSLHARIEQWNHNFSFDAHDPCVFHAPDVTGLLEHYKDPGACMFFEPLLSSPLHRTFPFSLQHLCRSVICGATSYDGIDALPVPSSMKLYLKEYHYKSKVRVRRVDAPERHQK